MHVTNPIFTCAPEPDWSGWENWLRSHLDIQREIMTEAFGEALGTVGHELRDRISALELKLAELTGAIDILRGSTPPPERGHTCRRARIFFWPTSGLTKMRSTQAPSGL